MNVIDDIILPEAARVGLKVGVDVWSKENQTYTLIYEVNGLKHLTPLTLNASDRTRVVRKTLATVKEFTEKHVCDDLCTTPKKWRELGN